MQRNDLSDSIAKNSTKGCGRVRAQFVYLALISQARHYSGSSIVPVTQKSQPRGEGGAGGHDPGGVHDPPERRPGSLFVLILLCRTLPAGGPRSLSKDKG